MRVPRFAIAASTAACILGGGAAAVAADTTRTGGEIQVFVTQQSQNESKVLITGAIGDYGTGLSVTDSGKISGDGNFQYIKLTHGSFIVDITALNKKLSELTPTFNESNCSIVFSGAGPGTIEHGTGDYSGITGQVEITVLNAGILPRTPTGGCSRDSNAPLEGAYSSITATGHVSFS